MKRPALFQRWNSDAGPHRLIAALWLALLASPSFAQKPSGAVGGGERITSFVSTIEIQPDGDLIVTETITANVLGQVIRRGITRDFPTRYRDRLNNRVLVDFDVLEVQRDGRDEQWHSENISNGIRIFFGQSDVFLNRGPHTFTLRYRTSRQIHFDADFDELYFNVTGTGWVFPIDRVEANVHLPDGAPMLETYGYTGAQGADGRAYDVITTRDGAISFRATAPLGAREGLTIAVSWPKGFVAEPTAADRAGQVLGDNSALLFALIGFLGIFAYYFWEWRQVGQDPAPGTVIPLFNPPKGFTPAAVRFVDQMNFDRQAFTAAVINMAVKGYLTIEEEGKTFRLVKASGDTSVLSEGEKAIAKKLLHTRSSIELKNEHHSSFAAAIEGLRKTIRREFEAAHFKRNSQYTVPGVLGHVLVMFAIAFTMAEPFIALFAVFWLSIGSAFAGLLGFEGYNKITQARGLGNTALGIFYLVLCIPILGVSALFFILGEAQMSWFAVVVVAAMGMLIPIFYELLKAPTTRGREVMDQIDGFKMYLSTAEKHRLEAFHPPEKTPELFEKYLPYALALDVENSWSEQFDDVLAGASAAADQSGGYQPIWYHGTHWHRFGAHGFASSLSTAMSSSIASAATAPGSSSGVGGGGFSGGGGGGGGGGGW